MTDETSYADELFAPRARAPLPAIRGCWFVGTSGYVFSDWRGTVYPAQLSERGMLAYYLDTFKFNALELNFTFYHMPTAAQMASFVARVPPRYQLAVKAHQSLTHHRGDMHDAPACAAFRDALVPLRDAHTLAAVLLQFPFAFHRTPAHCDWLRICRERFPDDPLAIEFRHNSWHVPETDALLRELGCAYCMVDAPARRGLMPLHCADTGPLLYVRLHGRNRAWFTAGEKERYNYNYSDEELRDILRRVRTLADQTKKILVFFNNCYMGRAVTNALRFRQLLSEA